MLGTNISNVSRFEVDLRLIVIDDLELQLVLESPIARQLWWTINSTHVFVSSHLKIWCLELADEIERKLPLSVEGLHQMIRFSDFWTAETNFFSDDLEKCRKKLESLVFGLNGTKQKH